MVCRAERKEEGGEPGQGGSGQEEDQTPCRYQGGQEGTESLSLSAFHYSRVAELDPDLHGSALFWDAGSGSAFE
jgi:hypothetical protein